MQVIAIFKKTNKIVPFYDIYIRYAFLKNAIT